MTSSEIAENSQDVRCERILEDIRPKKDQFLKLINQRMIATRISKVLSWLGSTKYKLSVDEVGDIEQYGADAIGVNINNISHPTKNVSFRVGYNLGRFGYSLDLKPKEIELTSKEALYLFVDNFYRKIKLIEQALSDDPPSEQGRHLRELKTYQFWLDAVVHRFETLESGENPVNEYIENIESIVMEYSRATGISEPR